MTASKLNGYWTLITLFLVVIIIIGGIVACSRYSPGRPIDISMPQGQELQGWIYIDGNVTNPGFYTLASGDTLEALIQAAGGTNSSANLSVLKLYIPKVGEEKEPQKVNINRAEVWLLEALPEIGPTLAERIVDYRQENGPYQNIGEIVKVEGIGTGKYEQLENLITVAD